MKTIIIPTDFSPIATNALHYGIDMAQAIDASLYLLHVYQVPITMTDVPIVLVSVEELQKNAEERLAKSEKRSGAYFNG
jgi:nucleotide-binding universal stress UspA family protein